MVKRFNWRADDRTAIVRAVASELAAGGIAILPTESNYQAFAAVQNEAAVGALFETAESATGEHLALNFCRLTDMYAVVDGLDLHAHRLTERCWPGPLVARVRSNVAVPAAALVGQLIEWIDFAGLVPLQMPDHQAALDVLREVEGPLISIASWEAFDAESALARAGGTANVVVDDGPTRFSKPPTIVDTNDRGFTVAFEGALSASRIRRLAGEIVIFVCTGNTCRSPMAEGIFKRLAAETLGCDVADLPEKGMTILSAGVAAGDGGPPARQAVEVAAEFGAAIDDHLTASLSPHLVRIADRIVTMTRDHKDVIERYWPEAAAKTTTLAGDRDIEDPVGQSVERYRQCARQIESHLRTLAKQIRARPE